jgi:hypothetical protein
MTWRATYAICRHVIGCHLTADARVGNALDDVASNSQVMGCDLTQGAWIGNALDDVASTFCQALMEGDGHSRVRTAFQGEAYHTLLMPYRSMPCDSVSQSAWF